MLQEEFTKFYNGLLRYANFRARRYFSDSVLREDAAEQAVDEAIDSMMATGNYDRELARSIINTSLRRNTRGRELEPIHVDIDGFHGYIISPTKCRRRTEAV